MQKLGTDRRKSGESGFYAFLNRNKKGVTLNLKNEKAREIFYDLVKDADVVVENFRVGVSKKLKVDYETLKKINPSIIYASGSGFGQYGPLSNRPCYDIVAQSMGGMVNMTGFPDSPPTKVGPSIADNVTGIYLCVGVLMALFNRERTGQGQQVDVAMADTIFSLLENGIVTTTMDGVIPQRQGNIDPSIAPLISMKPKTDILRSVSATTVCSKLSAKPSDGKTFSMIRVMRQMILDAKTIKMVCSRS